jgi:hypothetical protein
MIDFTVAYDKLSSLETADEIAQFLVSQGVKARRSDPSSCAVSEWMKGQTGLSIRTNFGSIRAVKEDIDRIPFTIEGTEHSHNLALSDFIFKFDRGDYPELESREQW